MNSNQSALTETLLCKVPQITLAFWVIKIMATTVGETAADFLIFNVGLGLGIALLLFFTMVFFLPNALGPPDNYIEANPLSTPAHIVPEWYFWPFYAILSVGAGLCVLVFAFQLIAIVLRGAE